MLVVTRQIDYYNGQKVVHVYFIQKLSGSELGNNDTSIIFGFINVAAKYPNSFSSSATAHYR